MRAHSRLLSNLLIPALAARAFLSAFAAGPEWEKLEGCRLVESRSNDADSFHVRHGEKEYIFRLYFVDAAETSFEFQDRIADQATYFGMPADRVPELGWKARQATAEFLKAGFTVCTKWHVAQGRSNLPRFYAFVRAEGRDVGEWLVERGLARIYGTRTTTPEGVKSDAFRARLREIEDGAKARREGAWSMAAPASAPGAGKQP